jgi:translation elongation factor EF-G
MDQLLRACGVETGTDRFMDSNALEKERGITISSKYTSMQWSGHVLNAVDTPGHADFGACSCASSLAADMTVVLVLLLCMRIGL